VGTHIEIDGRNFLLRDDQPLRMVMAEIEAAASSAPAFVTLPGDGQSISVLIRSTTRVVISVEKPGHVEPDHGPGDFPFDDWEL
jgi:hypothetical protein